MILVEVVGDCLKSFSNSLEKLLNKNNTVIASNALYKYLEALCSTFIVNRVYRYDIVGKQVLKTLNKFYATDLGVRKIKTNNLHVNYSQCFENIVYNELINKGYKAYKWIDDNYPKYVISKNKEDYSQDGIIHLNIFKFLMDDDF